MIYLLFSIVLLQFAYAAYVAQAHSRERWAQATEAAAERAELLQRIQAPQEAVIAHRIEHLPPDPVPLQYDNDEEYHASRDEMVHALMVAEGA